MTGLFAGWGPGSRRAFPRLGPAAACACLLASAGRCADPPAPETPAPGAPPALEPYRTQPRYEGRLRLEYDYRSRGNEQDSDLYGYLCGGAQDLADGRLDVYVSGQAHGDLDRSSSVQGTFRSVEDARGVVEDRFLQAYADAHDRAGETRLRLGRQYVDVADYLQLDGGQAMLFDDGDIGGRVYAGRPVSYYSSAAGDYAGGLSLAGRPWAGNRSRLTYAEYYEDGAGRSDRNVLADVRQEVSEGVQARARASVLNDAFRLGSADLYCADPGGDADLRLGASRWGEFDAATRAYSPLYAQLGPQRPYTYLYARMDYALGRRWMLSPGVSAKKADGGGTDYADRDYADYGLTATYEPAKSFSAALSLEYWDVSRGDGFLGLSGEVRYRRLKSWEASLGSAYTDYRYNSYSDIAYSVSDGQTVFREDGTVTQESPFAVSYFLRMRWNVTRRLTARLEGDVEDDRAEPDLSYRCRGSVEVRL